MLSVEVARERMAEANRIAEQYSQGAAVRRAAADNAAAARSVFARVLQVVPGFNRPPATRAA